MSESDSINKGQAVTHRIQQTQVKWSELYHSSEYAQLVKAKRRFVIPLLVLFTIYFVSLLILQGYFPDTAAIKVIGSLNVGYLFALSQFPVAWIVCLLYIRFSQKVIDLQAQKISEKSSEQLANKRSQMSDSGVNHAFRDVLTKGGGV